MTDPGVLLAALDAPDRAAVERFLEALALEPAELHCWPALRQVVELLAVLSLVADTDPGLSRRERFEGAADALDVSGDAALRRFYRIHQAAERQFVTGSEDAA